VLAPWSRIPLSPPPITAKGRCVLPSQRTRRLCVSRCESGAVLGRGLAALFPEMVGHWGRSQHKAATPYR
jgi:hypothetical protein